MQLLKPLTPMVYSQALWKESIAVLEPRHQDFPLLKTGQPCSACPGGSQHKHHNANLKVPPQVGYVDALSIRVEGTPLLLCCHRGANKELQSEALVH